MFPMSIPPVRPGSSSIECAHYPASGRYGGGGAADPRDRATTARSMTQQSRKALVERLCFVDVQSQPSPRVRDIVPAYGEPMDHLPMVRAVIDHTSSGRAEALLQVRTFVNQVRAPRSANSRPFSPRQHCWKVTRAGVAFLAVMGDLFGLAKWPLPDHRFDPYVQPAIDEFAATGLVAAIWPHMQPEPNLDAWRRGYMDPVIANLSNAFVQRLHELLNTNQAGRIDQLHKAQHDKRTYELRSYFSGLVKKHPAAHVERLELSAQGVYSTDQREKFKHMVGATTHLLRALGQRYGNAIVGDVRKVDRGSMGSYIVHLLLAVDGPNASELVDLRRTIRELWNEIFPNYGVVVSCNDFEQFMYRGCGALIRPHESLKGQLDKAAIFLAETDRMIHISYGEGLDGLLIGTVFRRPAL